jgi:D-alanyl-D-alanine carboxypeptidase
MRVKFIRIYAVIAAMSIAGLLSAQSFDSLNQRLERYDRALTEMTGMGEPGLSVVITQESNIIFEKYYGLANIEEKIPLKEDHHVGIASMSKQFTGMAVLFLVEDGKLNLEDNIKSYMPGLSIGDREITIRQLLSHTSGLPEITKNEYFMNHISEKHTIDEIIRMALEGEFRSNPGVKWQYCNTGYIIVARLIEILSGQSFASFLQERILTPLQMENTYTCDYNRNADNAVNRYLCDSTGYLPAATIHFSNLIGGGSIISNSGDIAKWCIALISGNKLPKGYEKSWESTLLNTGEETGYGLGLGNNNYKGINFIYHPGMGDGMNCVNFIIPEKGITINVLRNVSGPGISSIEVAQLAMECLFF